MGAFDIVDTVSRGPAVGGGGPGRDSLLLPYLCWVPRGLSGCPRQPEDGVSGPYATATGLALSWDGLARARRTARLTAAMSLAPLSFSGLIDRGGTATTLLSILTLDSSTKRLRVGCRLGAWPMAACRCTRQSTALSTPLKESLSSDRATNCHQLSRARGPAPSASNLELTTSIVQPQRGATTKTFLAVCRR